MLARLCAAAIAALLLPIGSVAAQQVVVYSPVTRPVASVPVVVGYPGSSAVVPGRVVVRRPAATTLLPPPPVVVRRPVTVYQPVVVPRPVMVVPRPVIVRPKVYIPGQPVRNFLRAITPYTP